jgi:DNA-binding beta-propeller fold protein YncE
MSRRDEQEREGTMKIARYACIAAALLALLVVLTLWKPAPDPARAAAAGNGWGGPGHGRVAPKFVVDPSWPKSLPHKWQIGQVPGIAVDKDDNIWIVHRQRSMTGDELGATEATVDTDGDGVPDADVFGNPRPQGSISDCCLPAPAVLQFDPRGNLLRAWGGPFDTTRCDPTAVPKCEWPASEHGIYVDHNMNVWLGGQQGRNAVKFSADGTFLLQIGDRVPPVRDSNDTDGATNGTPLLAQPADMEVDPETNELYIADGYTNLRVLVVDADTGLYKRHWGAYGQRPVDDTLDEPGSGGPYIKNQAPSPHFRNPVHAVRITKDGLVYVADRVNDRIQVFDKKKVGAADCTPAGPGTCGFIKEFFVARDTLGPGSTWDLDVSPDWRQTFLYNADGSNNYVWTLLRRTGAILRTFGRNGRSAGQFHWVHNMAVDSKGNIYTAEVDTGKRVQKFKSVGHQPY